MTLNASQLEAVQHHEGPLLVLAGAGSGKTRVLVHRIARLLESGLAYPNEILAVTFTNKAARELVERCRAMVGRAADELWVGTFHGIGARLLRRHGGLLGYPSSFSILDTDDQVRLLKDVIISSGFAEDRVRPEYLRSFIDAAKNDARNPSDAMAAAETAAEVDAASLYASYQQRLATMGAVDFGDLITGILRLFQSHPEVLERYQRSIRFLHIDEYQDTNRAQYLMVGMLAAHHRNLCVVGDDDQSIYAWRGADPRNILEFERDFPGAKVIRLEQNYRSTRNIIDAAAAVIAKNESRHSKTMWTDAEPGAKITVYHASDERDEARYVAADLMSLGAARGRAAVFYRTNAQSRAIEEELVRARMPYVIVGGTRFYERREVRDLIAYLRFANNPADDLSLERIINVPARGIGRTTWERLLDCAARAPRDPREPTRGTSVWQAIADDSFAVTLGGAARSRLVQFRTAAHGWLEGVFDGVAPLLLRILDDTGYLAYLEGRPDDDPTGRIENVKELVSVAQMFDEEFDAAANPEIPSPLVGFLERLALASDVDSYESREQAVTLMTVHNSKGLEYSHVFMLGMEEGVFPHSRSVGEDERGVEEERRLCYVGMTRARERLVLTRARRRYVFGSVQYNFASRFLDEIPPALLVHERSSSEHLEPAALREKPAQERFDDGWSREWHDWRDDAPVRSATVSPSRTMRRPETKPAPVARPGSLYKPGMRVVHPMFGTGTVRETDGTGESEKLIVQFQRFGLKKLVAHLARLEIVA
ncbi:MAG TPA: UvrD-helicase domain-containing protein [Candidatus Limnocylindrales bacterium]|nr:UvrD-helicase domain-containing protein [Candidatus Limnocylindrales bacterium]